MSFDYSESVLVQRNAENKLCDELDRDLVFAHNTGTVGSGKSKYF